MKCMIYLKGQIRINYIEEKKEKRRLIDRIDLSRRPLTNDRDDR